MGGKMQNEFYNDMDLLNGYMSYTNSLDLFNPYEGFLKGNGFRDLYVPYKNYKVAKINFNNEKEELLFNISEYSFMMHELNLYLDVNPNNKEALNKFNEYRIKTDELIIKYERKYGPLMVNSDTNKSFNWINKWPWVN